MVKEQFLVHHGILGQRWGIRRYQNKDGSLTKLGKKRLNYDNLNDQDYTIKKGTVGNRVTKISDYKTSDELDFYEYGSKQYKKSLKDGLNKLKKTEEGLDTKYVSMDTTKQNGKINGLDFYANWFSDHGYEGDRVSIDTYITKKDIKVASAKKVADELIKQYGDVKLNAVMKNKNATWNTMTLEYTRNKDLFNKVNSELKKKGYDAIEDINDNKTINPVIYLSAISDLSLSKSKSYEQYVKEKTKGE